MLNLLISFNYLFNFKGSKIILELNSFKCIIPKGAILTI